MAARVEVPLARSTFNIVDDHFCCFVKGYSQHRKVWCVLKALKAGVVFALGAGKVSLGYFMFAALYSHQHDVLLGGDEVNNSYNNRPPSILVLKTTHGNRD